MKVEQPVKHELNTKLFTSVKTPSLYILDIPYQEFPFAHMEHMEPDSLEIQPSLLFPGRIDMASCQTQNMSNRVEASLEAFEQTFLTVPCQMMIQILEPFVVQHRTKEKNPLPMRQLGKLRLSAFWEVLSDCWTCK